MTEGNGALAHATATADADALRVRLADAEDRLHHRVAELTAAVDERRALTADLAVKADWLEWMRKSLDAALFDLATVREELARSREERDAAIAERDRIAVEHDRVVAEAGSWRRDALLFDSVRRSAHRVPLYRRVGHPLLRPLLTRRSR
jgi:hypothetical protein